MPSRAGVARKVVDTTLSSSSNYVWLSDDILQHTYDRFAARWPTQCKRHGSNVPGPLEARRRLARRGFNNTVFAGAGASPNTDLDVNLGWLARFWTRSGQPDWRWEPPSVQEKTSKEDQARSSQKSIHAEVANYDITITWHGLPSWLDVRLPRNLSKAHTNVRSVEVSQETDQQHLSSKPSEDLTLEDYKISLAHVRDLADIKKLHFSFRYARADAAICSSLAFDHLLGCYHNLERKDIESAQSVRSSLFEFLEDPALDHSEGHNFMRLMKFLESKLVSDRECSTMIRVFSSDLSSAQAIRYTIPNVVEKLLVMASKVRGLDQVSGLSVLDSYRSIWLAVIHAPSTLSLDEDAAICRILLSYVLELPVRKKTRRLIKLIIRHDAKQFEEVRSNPCYDKGTAARIWTSNDSWRELMARTARYLYLFDLRNSERKGTVLSNRSHNFLASFNQSEYVKTMAVASTEHISHYFSMIPEKDTNSAVLQHWLEAFSKSKYEWSREYTGMGWAAIFDASSKIFRPTEILSHLPTLPHRNMLVLILRHWVNRDAVLASTSQRELGIPENDKVSNASTEEMGIYDAGPDNEAFEHSLSVGLRNNLQFDDGGHGVESFEAEVETQYVQLASMKTMTAWLGFGPLIGLAKDSMALLHSVRQLQPSSHELTAEYVLEFSLMLRSWRTFDNVARRLKHNLGAQFTIRHRHLLEQHIQRNSKKQPESALRIFNLDRRLHLSRVPQLVLDLITTPKRIHLKRSLALLWHNDPGAFVPPELRQYHPKCAITPERIHLVHEAALRFALSENYTTSAAWTGVTRCHEFLRTHFAPFGPSLSRALVVAGIVRPMKNMQRLPVEQVRFVLGVVRMVDGEEAADEVDRTALVYMKQLRQRMSSCDDAVDGKEAAGERRGVSSWKGRVRRVWNS